MIKWVADSTINERRRRARASQARTNLLVRPGSRLLEAVDDASGFFNRLGHRNGGDLLTSGLLLDLLDLSFDARGRLLDNHDVFVDVSDIVAA